MRERMTQIFANATEDGLDPAVLNWVLPYYHALPRLILNMAFLKVGLDGG
jgi:hypothetical protein